MGDPCVEEVTEETHNVSQEAKGVAMEACLFEGNAISPLH
jgi:hypothetical protein